MCELELRGGFKREMAAEIGGSHSSDYPLEWQPEELLMIDLSALPPCSQEAP